MPIVSYFGRYSIIVLCIHIPLMFYLPKFLKQWLGYEIPVWGFTAIILLFCWIAIPICKRFLPYFVVQKPLFKLTPKLVRDSVLTAK